MADLIKPSRRKFLAGVTAFLAAPAIVRVSSLMAIKPLRGLAFDGHDDVLQLSPNPNWNPLQLGEHLVASWSMESGIVTNSNGVVLGWVDAIQGWPLRSPSPETAPVLT